MRITAESLSKSYGDVTALDDLSLTIPAGTTYGVLGTNGAGKTTLFKLLVGHDRPDSGTLRVGGESVASLGLSLREQVGYLPERVGFPPALTGREVLQFHARMRDLPRDGRIEDVLEMVGLAQADAERAVAGYSNGMRRRLGLAAAILPWPAVLVLDEPTAGLDPQGVAEFHRIVDRVRERTDATVVLTSHVLSDVERVCEQVAVLHDGRVCRSGPVAELVAGTDTTVRLRPGDADELEELLAVAQEYGTARPTDGSISATCPSTAIPSLFAALEDGPALADVTVERNGLEAAFHETIESTEVSP